MGNPKYIIFDFDGTIADTIDLAFNIYNRIAPEYNCISVNMEDREKLRTKKPQELLKAYGVSNFKLFLIVLRIRKELSEHITEMKLVEEMGESLAEIKGAGFRLGILTSNSRNNVTKFLEKNDLTDIIDFVYSGKSYFGKDKVLRHLLEKENLCRENIIYVGDETRDIEASKKAGISVVAVTWGLNRRAVLASLMPDQIADFPSELLPSVQKIANK